MKKLFVFDVESVGLHGPGFAVGWVVLDPDGPVVLEEGYFATPAFDFPPRTKEAGWSPGHALDLPPGYSPHDLSGDAKWVTENLPMLPITHTDAGLMMDDFWAVWLRWREQAEMFADCAWPVEARFLCECVENAGGLLGEKDEEAKWKGPYPLHDIATYMLAHGVNPLLTYARLPNELPTHNPLNDARQSARLLVDLMKAPVPGS